ncbi:hemolysin family protein [Criblamydia sequanensis]|uniref:Uncharacterized protein n=1 Tax=Candidatus Criblamydia sequanensis CRIB-18 TaxID=1437425 RepID=A0A090CYK4_9BACT|nr:hemolysin family protein [Criblamydia sequanensis]CDR33672.1 Conserved hypothetical protein [Criblamydia sequanensis CRIB-18]
MSSSAIFWLLANFLTIISLAFFSMFEMAAVSFNKVRLHFYVSKGLLRAKWLSELLQNPSKLFCTTLIGVNVSMFVGSECAREFHEALGINPNWSPLSQVLLVIIFGELAPMFAARHYPETVAMSGIPIIYFSSKLLSPLIYILSVISKFANKLMGSKKMEEDGLFLSQEELQKILEEQDEETPHESDHEDINVISSNIFRLRKKLVKDIMTPIQSIPSLPSNATIAQTVNLIKKNDLAYIAVYHDRKENIIGIAKPRDLIRASEAKRIRDYTRAPWFITENSRLTDVLKQFKRSQENIAVILNDRGIAVGITTLDSLLKEIFGQSERSPEEKSNMNLFLQDKTFPGNYTVGEFKRKYGILLAGEEDLTLSDLIKENLSHPAEVGDKVSIGNVDLMVKEASFLEIKSVSITSWPR